MLYIDILGFSNCILNASNLTEKLKIYEEIYEKYNYNQYYRSIDSYHFEERPESTLFSDSILISSPELRPESSVANLPDKLKDLAMKRPPDYLMHLACDIQTDILLRFGLLVRGVIHLGPLHHEEHLIVGKGFIEAIEYEKKVRNPAIYLSERVQKEFSTQINSELTKNKRHTFYKKDEEDKEKVFIFPAKLVAEHNKYKVRELIQQGKENAPEDAKSKWEWMKRIIESYNS